MSTNESINLRSLLRRNRWQVIGTWMLVFVDAVLGLLFPLFIGFAIDDLINEELTGLILLGGLGIASVTMGAARRFYDTRVYSSIQAKLSEEIATQEHERNSNVSVISARTNMASEFVEFLENSFPEIINALIALFGTLVMIYFLQTDSFLACLIATLVIAGIYILTSGYTFRLNKGANDEAERQVGVLERNDVKEIRKHFRNVVRWNIRLSDLETLTFSLSWVVMIAVLLYCTWATVQAGIVSHGSVFAILMYVFSYIESVIVMPLYYQQIVRLREISGRLEISNDELEG